MLRSELWKKTSSKILEARLQIKQTEELSNELDQVQRVRQGMTMWKGWGWGHIVRTLPCIYIHSHKKNTPYSLHLFMRHLILMSTAVTPCHTFFSLCSQTNRTPRQVFSETRQLPKILVLPVCREEVGARQVAEEQLAQVQRSLEQMEQRMHQSEAKLRADMAERVGTLTCYLHTWQRSVDIAKFIILSMLLFGHGEWDWERERTWELRERGKKDRPTARERFQKETEGGRGGKESRPLFVCQGKRRNLEKKTRRENWKRAHIHGKLSFCIPHCSNALSLTSLLLSSGFTLISCSCNSIFFFSYFQEVTLLRQREEDIAEIRRVEQERQQVGRNPSHCKTVGKVRLKAATVRSLAPDIVPDSLIPCKPYNFRFFSLSCHCFLLKKLKGRNVERQTKKNRQNWFFFCQHETFTRKIGWWTKWKIFWMTGQLLKTKNLTSKGKKRGNIFPSVFFWKSVYLSSCPS